MNHLKRYLHSTLATALFALALTAAATAKAGGVPPSIDDLDGAVCTVKVGGTDYDLTTGAKETVKGLLTWTFTKTSATTLSVLEQDFEGDTETWQARYSDGVLVVAQVSDFSLSTAARSGYALVSGTQGKLKLKGEFVSFDTAVDEEAMIGKLAGKQISPL